MMRHGSHLAAVAAPADSALQASRTATGRYVPFLPVGWAAQRSVRVPTERARLLERQYRERRHDAHCGVADALIAATIDRLGGDVDAATRVVALALASLLSADGAAPDQPYVHAQLVMAAVADALGGGKHGTGDA